MTTPNGGDAATYVFCLVQSVRPPSLRGVPSSLPGAGAPRLISVDRGVWAVVADAPLERFSRERMEQELQDVEAISRHAIAHASVIEFFFRRSAVIPLKLFTLFSDDERAREHLARRRASLRRLFARLRGLEEWAVRVVAGEAERQRATRLRSGRDYLQAKKRLRDQAAAPSRATIEAAGGAIRALRPMAASVRKERFPPPGAGRPFVVGASFLVKATRRGPWRRRLARLGASLAREGHRLEVSGPWPPYHFVS